MAIPDCTKIVVSGTSSGGAEQWAFGWHTETDAAFDPTGLTSGSGPWPTFLSDMLSHMTPDQKLTQVDAYDYVAGAPTNHRQGIYNTAGTDTTGAIPLQCALVLTERTATLSRRGRGRIYLPVCGFSMMSGSNHLFNTTPVDTLVDDFANVLSAAAAAGHNPVVASAAASALYVITSVDADYVPDTQRRRRNKLTTGRHSQVVSGD